MRRGDVIGRCGNSGNAGMPHLHIGFLSSIDPIITRPMRFSDYERGGPDDAWHPGTGFPVKNELLRRRSTARARCAIRDTTSVATGSAASTSSASAGGSSVASWLSSIAAFMKCPARWARRARKSSGVPAR